MKKTKILFVCMGNICRSPTAEGVMRYFLEDSGLNESVEIDSAGTHGYHIGELPDPRTREHAAKRGYRLNMKARQFDPTSDFEEFDHIVVMDHTNLEDLKELDPENTYSEKIKKFTQFSSHRKVKEVPDPYYGGPDGFEIVLDIVEDCAQNFVAHLKEENNS